MQLTQTARGLSRLPQPHDFPPLLAQMAWPSTMRGTLAYLRPFSAYTAVAKFGADTNA
jgi:hypothetical protein